MNHPNRSRTNFVVVSAPGYYGDKTTVTSSHRTLDAAKRAAAPTPHHRYVVYEGAEKKGAPWFRVNEQTRQRVWS